MSTVIKVENISKQYRLGDVGTGALAHDVNKWWHKVRGKQNPYLKIGETNDRSVKGESDYVWALKDINFEVKQGEVLGIIGRNGAGKSTLLKILSKTTTPTTGSIKIKGRIASLLEVGTGFHPELSGRDNIFLNGAILGMTKKEIKSKFDEIVDFAGVERYIDTPVKRYSSGMYVRLAFGVAAHLEPEILIVDEVLAVGDAEFQKKALGKMKDVSEKGGRTVLFVSHNMTAINTLCENIIYLKKGSIERIGRADTVIESYMNSGVNNKTQRNWDISDAPGDEIVRLLSVRLIDRNDNDIDSIDFYKGGVVEYRYEILKEGFRPVPNVHFFNRYGEYIFVSTADQSEVFNSIGVYKTKAIIPPHLLNDGRYIVGIAISTLLPFSVHFFEKEALQFDVVENMEARLSDYRGNMPGVMRPLLKWESEKI